MKQRTHEYRARLTWTGNRGEGTASYTGYGRGYRVACDGRPDLLGSADPSFRGEAERHNPEDLFLGAIAACHMLVYLALCARRGVRVLAYEDDAHGTLLLAAGGGGRFSEVTLQPRVTVAAAASVDLARELHHAAHEQCFIAASCSVPIVHRPTVLVDGEGSGA